MKYNMLCVILFVIIAIILIIAVVRKGKLWGSEQENFRQCPNCNVNGKCSAGSIGGRVATWQCINGQCLCMD
jgi:hypothetical protein